MPVEPVGVRQRRGRRACRRPATTGLQGRSEPGRGGDGMGRESEKRGWVDEGERDDGARPEGYRRRSSHLEGGGGSERVRQVGRAGRAGRAELRA